MSILKLWALTHVVVEVSINLLAVESLFFDHNNQRGDSNQSTLQAGVTCSGKSGMTWGERQHARHQLDTICCEVVFSWRGRTHASCEVVFN